MWCGRLALCGLTLRAGSPSIVRSLARASARMSGLGSTRMVWSSSPDRASLDSRLCGHSCIRVVCNVRRICCPLFPLGFESHRSSSALTGSLGAPVVVGSEFSPYLGGVLVWSRPVLFPPSFRSSDGPAHTSPVGAYLGTCRLWRRHGAVLTCEARYLDRVHTEPAHGAAAHVDHLPVASM